MKAYSRRRSPPGAKPHSVSWGKISVDSLPACWMKLLPSLPFKLQCFDRLMMNLRHYVWKSSQVSWEQLDWKNWSPLLQVALMPSWRREQLYFSFLKQACVSKDTHYRYKCGGIKSELLKIISPSCCDADIRLQRNVSFGSETCTYFAVWWMLKHAMYMHMRGWLGESVSLGGWMWDMTPHAMPRVTVVHWLITVNYLYQT